MTPKLFPFWWLKASPYYPRVPHLLLTEYWNLGPPSVFIAILTETWTIKQQPTFTLLLTEQWIS